jgi:hypothetical protein
VEMGGHCWQDQGSEDLINARYEYYATKRNHATLAYIAARIIAGIEESIGRVDAELEQVVHTLEWVRIDEFVGSTWCGRSPCNQAALASAFAAMLGLGTTAGLIERLAIDRALRRICGFSVWKRLPDESTFSRAFAEFAALSLNVFYTPTPSKSLQYSWDTE